MTNVVYSKPTIEKVASFKESTKGLWTGKFKDLFGGRAVIKIEF
ncbi:lasso RiPP family leader peptide-containing protein [Paenibacillus thiaminolyticus]|nr:lasso RiPP family leader peptide-containing protein [Paenibacillus thiaminolyticus]WCF07249.1 lasso RiPP family leader peptide-containing protein [Paenibacillus thiaminolyticus]WII36549.1 lasso RiPP family leader peptide-containing protein [Paenibacillus thiaminolyticus]